MLGSHTWPREVQSSNVSNVCMFNKNYFIVKNLQKIRQLDITAF